MDLNFLWPLIGGALGAAIINSVFSFYKLRRDADLESAQYRRDHRREVFGKYLAALVDYETAMHRVRQLDREDPTVPLQSLADSKDAYRAADPQMRLTAPAELLELHLRLMKAMSRLEEVLPEQLVKDRSEQLNDEWKAIRRELAAAKSDFVILARHDTGMLDGDPKRARAALVSLMAEVQAEYVRDA